MKQDSLFNVRPKIAQDCDKFRFLTVNIEKESNTIINSLNSNKETEPDDVLMKIIKEDNYIIHGDIEWNRYLEGAKSSLGNPCCK